MITSLQSGMSSAATTLGFKTNHSIAYVFGLNFLIRGILYMSMYINSITTKNAERSLVFRDALQHSFNTFGLSIASLFMTLYTQRVIDTSEHNYNSYLNALLLILLYVVILYDAMVPLFKKKKIWSKKADRKGALAGLIIMPLVIAGFIGFIAYEFDTKVLVGQSFKLIIDKYSNLIIMFIISIIFSLLSFFMLYASEMNKNKNPGVEEKVKLMKSFFMVMMITIFMMVLVIEYLKINKN